MGGKELLEAVGSLSETSPLRESCEYVASTPGKRFRASVLFAAAEYGETLDWDLVKQSAVAVELFHAATLAHDDVVDDGQLRRGKPSIGAHSGNLAASLSGGWLFARAVELIADAGEEATVQFGKTAAKVCEGEMLEARDLYDADRSRARYQEAIEAKTASLIGFAAWLGATVGGAEPETVSKLEQYGDAVGMAFQIADDVLDLIGDPEVTGKTAGSDLRQGVYTLPVIYALEADPSLRSVLVSGPEQHELPALVERVRALGAVEAALGDCTEWIERAHSFLPGAELRPGSEERLVSLAGAVSERVEGMVR